MDLSDLNEQQYKAVIDSIDCNTVVIAGAGSGKTKTMTSRVGYLIDDLKVEPENIMVVTFTNKAAKELKSRIYNVCSDVDKMWIGTFHHICNKILKEFGTYIGINSFNIMDTYQSKKTIHEAMNSLGMTYDKAKINQYAFKISKYKSTLTKPDNIPETEDANFTRVYRAYQDICWSKRTFDFDDLIVYTICLLTSSNEVRTWFYENIKYVMCDETQDTNGAQFSFLRLITGNNNLFVVGDDSQSIYGFRNARPEFILNFQKIYPYSRILQLDRNYRSTQTIVNASNAVINNNLVKYEKKAFSKNIMGNPILYHRCQNQENEASYIASEIMMMNNPNYDEIAILYRTNAQSRVIEKELMDARIPCKMVNAISFYDRKEIKDILSFAKYMNNHKDSDAFIRAFGCMKSVGKKTIENVMNYALQNNIDFHEAFDYVKLSTKAKKSADDFKIIISHEKDVLSDIFNAIIKYSHIAQDLIDENTPDSLSRLNDIKELVSSIKEIIKDTPNITLSDYLDSISLASPEDTNAQKKAVHLMTIHSAKGLEFDTVFIAGADDGILPLNCDSNKQDEVEEERRLFYVAMTRAKSTLYITSCAIRWDSQTNIERSYKESRFISEIPDKYLMQV